MDMSRLTACQKSLQVRFNFLTGQFNFPQVLIDQIFQNMNHLCLLDEVRLFLSKKSKQLLNFLHKISHTQETIKYSALLPDSNQRNSSPDHNTKRRSH